MPRRVKNDSIDTRDWMTRAQEQITLAESLPAGPERDEAIRKAEQFRSAAEMMGFLHAGDTKAPR
jgi:hypothetical protein